MCIEKIPLAHTMSGSALQATTTMISTHIQCKRMENPEVEKVRLKFSCRQTVLLTSVPQSPSSTRQTVPETGSPPADDAGSLSSRKSSQDKSFSGILLAAIDTLATMGISSSSDVDEADVSDPSNSSSSSISLNLDTENLEIQAVTQEVEARKDICGGEFRVGHLHLATCYRLL